MVWLPLSQFTIVEKTAFPTNSISFITLKNKLKEKCNVPEKKYRLNIYKNTTVSFTSLYTGMVKLRAVIVNSSAKSLF